MTAMSVLLMFLSANHELPSTQHILLRTIKPLARQVSKMAPAHWELQACKLLPLPLITMACFLCSAQLFTVLQLLPPCQQADRQHALNVIGSTCHRWCMQCVFSGNDVLALRSFLVPVQRKRWFCLRTNKLYIPKLVTKPDNRNLCALFNMATYFQRHLNTTCTCCLASAEQFTSKIPV